MSDRDFGTVKWFEDFKGYGFIRRDGDGDIFVQLAAIEMDGRQTLVCGQRVTFTVKQGKRDPRASHATPLYTVEEARWAGLHR